MSLLSLREFEFWEKNGYLIHRSVFNDEEVKEMRDEADFILGLILNSSLYHRRHSRRLDIRKNTSGGMVVRKIQPIIDLSLNLAKFSTDERLIRPMQELMGEEPVLMEEKLNYKQPVPTFDLFQVPLDDDRFPIHNDWAYYKYDGYPANIISSAITVDACHETNGSMQVFPGSHKKHVEHLRVRNGLEVPEGTIDRDEAKTLVVPAGSIMFFHARLIHTSDPNRSGSPRRVIIYSHYPKSASMGIDRRNGPNRLRESPWEWEYQRAKARGQFEDRFNVTG